MNRYVLFVTLIFLGCGEERNYNGGEIIFDQPDQLPDPLPVCDPVEDPVEWEPLACNTNDENECCVWKEQKFSQSGDILTECTYNFCYSYHTCEWEHILSSCEGG